MFCEPVVETVLGVANETSDLDPWGTNAEAAPIREGLNCQSRTVADCLGGEEAGGHAATSTCAG